jgi:hypothetical protein
VSCLEQRAYIEVDRNGQCVKFINEMLNFFNFWDSSRAYGDNVQVFVGDELDLCESLESRRLNPLFLRYDCSAGGDLLLTLHIDCFKKACDPVRKIIVRLQSVDEFAVIDNGLVLEKSYQVGARRICDERIEAHLRHTNPCFRARAGSPTSHGLRRSIITFSTSRNISIVDIEEPISVHDRQRLTSGLHRNDRAYRRDQDAGPLGVPYRSAPCNHWRSRSDPQPQKVVRRPVNSDAGLVRRKPQSVVMLALSFGYGSPANLVVPYARRADAGSSAPKPGVR